MSRSLILALTCTGLLSACSGQLSGTPPQPGMHADHTHSVGFSGIGHEPFLYNTEGLGLATDKYKIEEKQTYRY